MSGRGFFSRNLALIAIVAFGAAAIALSGAWLMMGSMGIADFAIGLANARLPVCGDLAGRTASRELAWNAGGTASIGIPATLRYSPHNGAQVTVTGDAALLPHVRVVDDGQIELDCRARDLADARLDITLPGRSFRSFNMAGLTRLVLSDIDQNELHMNIAGSSSVEATGRAESVHVNAAGRSDARLGMLAAEKVELNLAGSSNIEIAPEDELTVNAFGSATVTLLSEPKTIHTNIVGSGRIIHKAL